MPDYADLFADYLVSEKKCAKNTLDSYMRDVRGYLSYLSERELDACSISKKQIEDYLAKLSRQGKSGASIMRTLGGLRCFYRFLLMNELVLFNPAAQIKLGHVDKPLPEVLSVKEIDMLLSQPDTSKPKGCRDKAMLELLYATGMRVSELICVNLEDLNLQINMIRCVHEGNDRMIPVYNEAINAVEDYLSRVRPQICSDRTERSLFLNMNGKRMTRQGFWKIIKKYADEAGIEKTITPHTMRHSLAAQMLENGADIRDLKELLGHSGLSTTLIYTRILRQKYDESYKKYHPKAGN